MTTYEYRLEPTEAFTEPTGGGPAAVVRSINNLARSEGWEVLSVGYDGEGEPRNWLLKRLVDPEGRVVV